MASCRPPRWHTATLTGAAYRLYGGLGLQCARVLTLNAAAEASHQCSFDPLDDRLRIEAVADRARARFGPDSIGPATRYGAA
ncbi:hypothetical protein [Kitasatospora sp. NPDC088346]|uniref:hypothetical protein n=1 Tax=Kitasatospora sp. NPDC088346 TaxID=3364073 RepID=UPI0038030E00